MTHALLTSHSGVPGLEELLVALTTVAGQVSPGGHREVIVENSLDLVKTVHLVQPLAERGRAREPLHIPSQVLAELQCRAGRIDLVLLHHACVLERGLEPDRDRWR